MKLRINHILVFFIFLICFSACQEESNEVENPTEQEAIVPNSTLANLMQRTTANSPNLDDFFEDYDCFSVVLPVTVIADGQTIAIVSENDFVQLSTLIEDNDFEFVYPITIIFGDYSEIVIENEEQLETYVDDCDDNEETSNIECINFVYPISFSIFNSEFNLVNTVSIADDEALHDFLEGLDDDENATIVSVDYPVTLVYANGEAVEVNTNQELVDAIGAAEEDCDDDCSQEAMSTYLTSCSIVPTLDGYTSPLTTFSFNEDNTLFTMYQGDLPYSGVWSYDTDNNGIYIDINFNGLENYNGKWYLQECDDEGFTFSKDDSVLILICQENYFECFENVDIEICDDVAPYDDGITTIDLNTLFDCPQDNIEYAFYLTEMDAQIDVNQLITSNFTNYSNPQTLYVRAQLVNNPEASYQISTINIVVEDCNEDCENEGVLTDDLVIYMPFSNEVKDLISDWELASFSNGFVEDRNGNATCAIEFTDTNPITIPTVDDSEIVQGESFSISLWFKMQNTAAGDLEIFFRSPGNATQGFQLGVYDLNSPLFSDNLSTSIWDNDWNSEVDVEWENTDWHHLVATVDENNTIKLYRDGVLRNSIENSSFSVGTQPAATYLLGEGFTGYLDDLRVYKRALSTNDIQVLYQLESDCNTCLDD